MAIYPMLLLLLMPGQDEPKPDTPEDRARRASIVDRIMAQPILPRPRIDPPAAVEETPDQHAKRLEQLQAEIVAIRAQEARQIRRVQVFDGQKQRSLTIEQPTPAVQDGEIDPPEPAVPMRLNLKDAVLERENFDRWIFGDGIDEEARRVRLQTLLSEKVDRVMKDHTLDGMQLRKLRLAGSGDIKRFLDRVEESRAEFEDARQKFNIGWRLLRELEPLSNEFREGPFGDDSFLAKTLRKIVDDSKGRR